MMNKKKEIEDLLMRTYKLAFFLRKSQVSDFILNEVDYKNHLIDNNKLNNAPSYDEYLLQNLKIRIENSINNNTRFLDSVENERDYFDLIERERLKKGISPELAKSTTFKEELIEMTLKLINENKTLPVKYQDTKAKEAGEKFINFLTDGKSILENQFPLIFKDDIGYTIFVKVREKFKDGVDSPNSFFANVFHYLKKQYLVTQDPKIFIEYLRASSIKYNEDRIRERETKKYKDIIDKTVAELGIKQ